MRQHRSDHKLSAFAYACAFAARRSACASRCVPLLLQEHLGVGPHLVVAHVECKGVHDVRLKRLHQRVADDEPVAGDRAAGHQRTPMTVHQAGDRKQVTASLLFSCGSCLSCQLVWMCMLLGAKVATTCQFCQRFLSSPAVPPFTSLDHYRPATKLNNRLLWCRPQRPVWCWLSKKAPSTFCLWNVATCPS